MSGSRQNNAPGANGHELKVRPAKDAAPKGPARMAWAGVQLFAWG